MLQRPLMFGSLFAGIGGFDLGFERAGMLCRWQVEIDDWNRGTLARHWPDVRRWDDVRTWPRPDTERVDVICGGFPCKQTSTVAAVHNRRNGLDGKDSGLWYEMLRIVETLRPEIVVVENVAGATTWSPEITGGLEAAGYAVDELRLAAEEFGACHPRWRMFFVADVDRERFSVTWPAGSCEVEPSERRAIARNHWDADSSEFRRMAHGLSDRVDRATRIERLGNAVVPQMSEWIGRRIVAGAAAAAA